MSEQTAAKVTGAHLARTAYLYVRQSTLRQVLTNTESATRQYALRQKAIALGWQAEQIVTIDTDQGQSGASAADREGFQRLVAEVGMGRAGIALGLEVSRLARNNADWHRLLEICAMSATLICDEDGLYDPTDFNDRLLLGLKGTMSEAELHFIRARLIGGQLSKARRGELQMGLPIGLVYDPTGKVVLDPDTGVQQAIRQVFSLFARTGSARATVQQFNADGLLFPVRVRTGTHKGELAWMPLQHWRVLRTLHNPRYAGAFAFGRRRDRLAGNGKKSYQLVPREQWIALIRDAHPGYISWDTYETNQKLLLGNATAHGADRAAGPDNRLVADSLEADWNDALRALQTAREDYERASETAAAALTDQIRHQIQSLATDFPALWTNPHTPQRDRKRMVRLLVDDVTLHKTDRIHLHVRLRGGQTRSLAVAIPPTSWQARQTRPDTVKALDQLLDTHTEPRPPKRSTPTDTAPARTNHSPPASSSTSATSTICLITPTGSAPKACSPQLNSPNASQCTPAPSRVGPRLESSTPTRQTTRMNVSTNHRSSTIPASLHDKAAPSENEFPPNPRQEVHYETKPLSRGLRTPVGRRRTHGLGRTRGRRR
jgi:DNA invertase Pin-like site-specific DNA recombinase